MPTALTPRRRPGLKLFIDKGCAACHNGINVGGGKYAPFGVVEKPGAELLPPDDKGRFVVTKTASDEYVFKVPTLRNIELTAPYFHSGSPGICARPSGSWQPVSSALPVTDDEADKIVAFLGGTHRRPAEDRLPGAAARRRCNPAAAALGPKLSGARNRVSAGLRSRGSAASHGTSVMRRPLSFSLIVMLLATGPAHAADDLLTAARARFQPIPLKAPELPGNPATPAEARARPDAVLRPAASPRAARAAATPATTWAWPARTARRPRSATAGRRAAATCRPPSTRCSTRPGSGTAAPRTWTTRPAGRPSTPSRWHFPRTSSASSSPRSRVTWPPSARRSRASPRPVTLANAQKAIAVFQATLITPNAPFDRYLRGDASALNADAEGRACSSSSARAAPSATTA